MLPAAARPYGRPFRAILLYTQRYGRLLFPILDFVGACMLPTALPTQTEAACRPPVGEWPPSGCLRVLRAALAPPIFAEGISPTISILYLYDSGIFGSFQGLSDTLERFFACFQGFSDRLDRISGTFRDIASQWRLRCGLAAGNGNWKIMLIVASRVLGSGRALQGRVGGSPLRPELRASFFL